MHLIVTVLIVTVLIAKQVPINLIASRAAVTLTSIFPKYWFLLYYS